MTTLKLVTCDQHLVLQKQPVVASGDKNSVQVQIELCSMWDGFDVKVAFYKDGNRDFVLDIPLEDGACMVPPEMLDTPCVLNIGIWGKDASGRYKTSTMVKYRVLEGTPIEEGVRLVAVNDGTATEDQVLDGATFYAGDTTKKRGNIATFEDGEPGFVLKGDPGESAYDIEVKHGFKGTEEEWLASLKKPAEDAAKNVVAIANDAAENALKQAKESGEFDGKSAYAYAKDGGYTGTEEEFAEKLATETFVTPQMYGAKGDGMTDDTEKMSLAATAEKTIDLSGKSYVVRDTVALHAVFKNGTLIYKGDASKPVVSLKDGGGLVDVKIIIAVENYASSVVLADYTAYTTQWTPMRFTIDGLYIDNTITSEFVEGSSCIKITYDKWKVIGGQNLSNVTLKGFVDYGIHIEPQLRNTGSGNPRVDDNPVFNSAVFSNIKFECCNTALKVCPKMLNGEADTALGAVGLMLLKFTNENNDKQVKPFFDLHNTTITGDMVIPWDYYGSNIPEQGTYRLHNSHVNVNTAYFMRGNHSDDVRYSWFYDTGTGEYYTNHNVIKPENIADRLPFRTTSDGSTPWSVDTIKAVRFKPDGSPYDYMGFEMTYNGSDDPKGQRTVQFGFSNAGRMVWRGYDTTSKTWSDLHHIYADGTYPVSYNGKRPDGLKAGDYRFDTSKGKPIFWNGEKWIFADGMGISETAETVYYAGAKTAGGSAIASLSNEVKLISANSNLDEYTTAGFFGVRASADANTIANNPFAGQSTGFLLEVYDIGGLILQKIYGTTIGGMYLRRYTSSSGWSNWRHIPVDAEGGTA